MSVPRAFITSAGVVSAAGLGWQAAMDVLRSGKGCQRPLSLFPTPGNEPPLAGEISQKVSGDDLPRTHTLALLAAQEALNKASEAPDAVVVGVTTGGMPKSEVLLGRGEDNPRLYKYHGAGSVAELLARRTGCLGPTLTVSTACSSGTTALKAALEMIRAGWARRVLVCGVDALCRLTFFGFRLMQLVDPRGSRPLDRARSGMSLGEAAAAFVVTADVKNPGGALAEIRGAGLSCDAHHPTAPHPQGAGAEAAMRAALADAGGLSPSEIDYINLHGTGTRDNDSSEAAALRRVFQPSMPAHSSTKGVFGHTLAAAGALEAAVCLMALTEGFIPANLGLTELDPELGLDPVRKVRRSRVRLALSNSLGFGGANASVVLGDPNLDGPSQSSHVNCELEVLGSACLTGAGDSDAAWECFRRGDPCHGLPPDKELGRGLPPRRLRRLKRLSRMALSLARAAVDDCGREVNPNQVFLGTGGGSLSETHDFLCGLLNSHWRHGSPIDFMGSVHNAPAGQIALHLKAAGANVTTSGEDYSFEQALLAACLMNEKNDSEFLLIGADEYHPVLSPLLRPKIDAENASDGGGALIVRMAKARRFGIAPRIRMVFFRGPYEDEGDVTELVSSLGKTYGVVMVGAPALHRDLARAQMTQLQKTQQWRCPLIDYRSLTGQFPTAAAVAAVFACRMANLGYAPAGVAGGRNVAFNGKPVLMLTLGRYLAAAEIVK